VSGDVTFSPDAMEEVAADLDLRADTLDEVASDVDAALSAYISSSREFVPAIPAHASMIEAQGDLMRGVATGVLDLAAAAREADAQGVDLRRLLASGAHLVGGAATAVGGRDAIQRLLRLSVHGVRDVRAATSQLRLVNRYGSRAMPSIAAIRREVAGGHAMNRRRIRPIQMERYRELKRQRRDLHRARAAARTGMRTNGPLTRFGSRVDDFLSDTRTGRGLRTAGRGLGIAGVGLGGFNTIESIREGDTEGAVVNGLSTVGGALMLTGNPVTMGIGAAITVGVLVYDNWDAISDVGAAAVDTVADVASSVGSGVVDFGSSVVSGAADLIGGLF
jgi:hypothetical protein